MAPEQVKGSTANVGVDIYGIGAILYECLTGRPPFQADTVFNTLAQITNEEPVPPRRLHSNVPIDLETICLKCLDKEPAKRYQSCDELAQDLRRFLAGEPIAARRAGLVERSMKWARRRPSSAALLIVCAVGLLAMLTSWAWFTIRLDRERADAIIQRDLAKSANEKAQRATEALQIENAETLRQSKRAYDLLTLMATAVDDIAVNVRTVQGKGSPSETLFKLAVFYARTSAKLAENRDMPKEDRDRLADQYAASAVRLLGCAESAGYFTRSPGRTRKFVEADADLKILSTRKDFQKFLVRLPN